MGRGLQENPENRKPKRKVCAMWSVGSQSHERMAEPSQDQVLQDLVNIPTSILSALSSHHLTTLIPSNFLYSIKINLVFMGKGLILIK